MNIFLKYLRQLTRRETPTQSDLVHVYSPVTGKDHYVLIGDLLSSGSYPAWSSGTTYAIDAKVTYGLRLWQSLQNANLSNVPSEGAWWTEVSPAPVTTSLWGGLWNFAGNGNDFPVADIEGQLFVAQDDHGAPGDADYVPAGTWMAAKINGADAFSEYYLK